MAEGTGEKSSEAESNPPEHPVFLSYASTDAATAQRISLLVVAPWRRSEPSGRSHARIGGR
jgi:hypothetical protein